MSDAHWSFAQDFSTTFQSSRLDLENRLHAAKSSSSIPTDFLSDLSQALAKLSKSLADANDRLPSYDRRQYGLQVKAMEKLIEELRAASKPNTKFAFKRSTPAASVSPSPVAPDPPPVLEEQRHSDTPSNDVMMQSSTNHIMITSCSNRYITSTDLPSSRQPSSDLTISDLDHCIINLACTPASAGNNHVITELQLSAVHVNKLTNCVLILPMINGSVLLYDISQCIIAVGCHQFRMHSSTHVDVYLLISSMPVIEHCSSIRFTAYPETFINETRETMMHFSVQDFSHIRPTPSPHWSKLPQDTTIISWPLTATKDVKQLLDVISEVVPPVQ
ncbi:hypothetical protein AMATHDRAFT_137393 [Amanita thiersii Skay4041]|uniref:C-CAP/cofactor C-like domain-containing protein n=1 Tax=Amanita thiersii Skay4041 TaxID=703135 RepID=A0A2A9NZC9_9AGAR|nr:hypothetical protein AMATHDRAFT_137393 [Amanita thiersii Skay4041]